MDQIKATKGAKWASKYDGVVHIEVLADTQVGAQIYLKGTDRKTGEPKLYGPYRVAAVLKAGEDALTTHALAYKDSGAAKGKTLGDMTKAEMIAEIVRLSKATAVKTEEPTEDETEE